MNDPVEELLREQLGRIDPPPGLRDRVLAALPRPRRSARWIAPAAAAAALVMSAGAGWVHLQQQRHARQTRQQAIYALQLAGNKLAAIDLRLRRSSPEIFLKERN